MLLSSFYFLSIQNLIYSCEDFGIFWFWTVVPLHLDQWGRGTLKWKFFVNYFIFLHTYFYIMDFLNDCNAMVATCTILSIWNNTLLLRIYIYIFFLMLESIFWRVHVYISPYLYMLMRWKSLSTIVICMNFILICRKYIILSFGIIHDRNAKSLRLWFGVWMSWLWNNIYLQFFKS